MIDSWKQNHDSTPQHKQSCGKGRSSDMNISTKYSLDCEISKLREQKPDFILLTAN